MTSSALTFDDAIDLDAMWELLNDEFEAYVLMFNWLVLVTDMFL